MGADARGQVLRMSDARSAGRAPGQTVENHAWGSARARIRRESIGGHRHRVCHRCDGQCSQGVVHACW
ncbi:hypothetical protein GZL_04351 [Streptomyces sp. 769]|nr:hypothetical protein GZL_04351 [Streptomyces sp. 769]